MIFNKTKLSGAYVIEIEKIKDKRGFFARSWDKKEFEKNGLNSNLVQCSISLNVQKGVLRGLHYQNSPYEETKLVRCTKGRIFDVIVDLREDSPTKNKWIGVELTELNHKMIYAPEGFAHGFQALEKNSEIFYQMSQEYKHEYARVEKWNDDRFKIEWPIIPPILSERDSQ